MPVTITACANSTPASGTIIATTQVGSQEYQHFILTDSAGSPLGQVAGSPFYARITNTAASIALTNPTGSVIINNPTGSVFINNPTGSVLVTNMAASIALTNPTGSVLINNPTGSMLVTNWTGSAAGSPQFVSVVNSTGSVLINNPTASMLVTNLTGSAAGSPIFSVQTNATGSAAGSPTFVSLTNSTGSMLVTNMAASIALTNPTGSVLINNPTGSMLVTNLTGSAAASPTFVMSTIDVQRVWWAGSLLNASNVNLSASTSGCIRMVASSAGNAIVVMAATYTTSTSQFIGWIASGAAAASATVQTPMSFGTNGGMDVNRSPFALWLFPSGSNAVMTTTSACNVAGTLTYILVAS